MLVAQNSLGPVCPVPLTVRGTRDMISVVCAFWLRVGEYHPDTDALIDFCS